MKKFLLFVVVLFIYGCKKQEKTTTSDKLYLDYQIADSLSKQRNDSAFYYYNKVATNSTDRLIKARAYNRMAALEYNSGDHFSSQEAAIASLKLLDEKTPGDHPYLLSNYNLLGRSYLEQKNYDEAIKYFKKAEPLQENGKQNPILLNNIGVAYQKKKDYSTAKLLFQSAIDSSKNDTLGYARALSNLARTKWLEDPSYDASPELLTALNLRKIKNDQRGLETSYSHLADYYLTTRPDSSLSYAKKMYLVAQNPEEILDAIKKITSTGSPKDIKDYSTIYYKINDSLEQARNISRNQFVAMRFDSEKSKAENLQLQRDNFKQRVYLYATLAGFIILSAFGIAWYRRRKRRIEQESQDKIREHELKTSKKIHDVVANGLYGVMTGLEHQEKIDKESLLDKIEILYEQSRDISYDQPVFQNRDYSMQIHRLFSSFGTTRTKILIAGNKKMTWDKLSVHEKEELEYVLQELMVNMSKHSRAKNVAIRFAEEGDCLRIYYKDDGVGFSPGFKIGNGLRNTENRIKNLRGEIIFDGMDGLKIEITLPIVELND